MFAVKFHKPVVILKHKPQKHLLRFIHKLDKQNKQSVITPATDVLHYIDNVPEYKCLKDQLPKGLLKKYKTPESMYLINKNTAKVIADTLNKYIDNKSPVVEVNPGLGYLSKELLDSEINHIYMFESLNHFSSHIHLLQTQYPDKCTYKIADFFGMWKLAFKDKMDQGTRIKDLLGDLATDNNDRVVKIVGSMPGLSFIKHLMNTIIFHNTTNQLGRPDLFITMPGYHYEFLTDNEIQFTKHKSTPALFQLLFDFKVLNNVPKVHFLPWTFPATGKRMTVMNINCMYLVNITQKKKLPCPPEYLPLLWYFFKPHMFSKSTKVIPFLEQWIPGCGIWLISGQDPPDINKEIAPGKDDAELPHMTIFTEFGDLTLNQKLTVFKKFVSLPEFEHCQFRLTMENNLPKFILPIEDEDKDSIGTHIDEIEHSDSDIDTM
ncbi:dimethyladenosine transferase 2, mitochondrial [Achroia grisella]|uniref:dimethyladenosine transferase 2, mitochondrial n=1 Tax=Achroia grisella TaxID=688607 RepID=UPI0027D33658|nr:dimethyladenosine transferase 2, mitochondrial [Achroia grisella]